MKTNANPCNYSQPIFNKGAQNMHWGKDTLFSKWCWENWISTCRRLKQDPNLSPCTSINSKWFKDVPVIYETVKLIQENIENTLNHIGIGNNFRNETPLAQQLRESIDKWVCIKLYSFCTAKETVTRLKRQSTEWEKIFASSTSDKKLITRIYRELKKLTSQRVNSPLNKWANELNRQFSKEYKWQKKKKHMKKCSTSLAIKKMHITTTLRFHLTLVKMVIINNTNNKCW
jgi:hypothetical protein